MGKTRRRKRPDRDALNREIGRRIRERRRELAMPMADVANFIGVSLQQLQKYEVGEDSVAASTLIKIAHALQIEAGSLLSERATTAPINRTAAQKMSVHLLVQAFDNIPNRREKRLLLELARCLGGDHYSTGERGVRATKK